MSSFELISSMCFVSGGIHLQLQRDEENFFIFYDNHSAGKAKITSNLFGAERLCENNERHAVLSVLKSLIVEVSTDRELINTILKKEGGFEENVSK